MIYLASFSIILSLLVGGFLLLVLARQKGLERALRSLEERFQVREKQQLP